MQAILVQILIGLAQLAMAAFGGFLVERHIITGAQEQTLVAWVGYHALIVAPIVAGIVLMLWQKRKGFVRQLVALMPGIHTMQDVDAYIASGKPTPTVLTPSNTVPGVPK